MAILEVPNPEIVIDEPARGDRVLVGLMLLHRGVACGGGSRGLRPVITDRLRSGGSSENAEGEYRAGDRKHFSRTLTLFGGSLVRPIYRCTSTVT